MYSRKHLGHKQKVEEWLLKKRISIADMEPYFSYYPDTLKKIVRELYR